MLSYCHKCVYLREACEDALKQKHFLEVPHTEGSVEDDTTHLEQLEALGKVFVKVAEHDMPTEVHTYNSHLLFYLPCNLKGPLQMFI